MPAALIAQLIIVLGPPAIGFITGLIAKWETGTPVTQTEWNTMTSALSQTAADRMKANLIASGIDPTSPQGIAMLALAK